MKERYLEFCEKSKLVPVFGQPWYLDIVCEKDWEVVVVEDKEGNIVGVWPHMWRKKSGFSFLQMPHYTPFLGPFVFFPDYLNSEYKRNSFYFQTVQDLANQLPKASYLNLKLPPNHESWFPLYELGFKQTTRYTYVIDHKLGKEQIKQNLKPKLRNVICKEGTEDLIQVSETSSEFVALLETTFESNGIGQFFLKDKIQQLIDSAIAKRQGSLYSFKDMDSGIFILEDSKKRYCLFTATNEEGKSQEGVGKLIWRAVNDSIEIGKDFDFEGSMLPGVERFFRSFGGEQKPYHLITKISHPLLKVYKFLRP